MQFADVTNTCEPGEPLQQEGRITRSPLEGARKSFKAWRMVSVVRHVGVGVSVGVRHEGKVWRVVAKDEGAVVRIKQHVVKGEGNVLE